MIGILTWFSIDDEGTDVIALPVFRMVAWHRGTAFYLNLEYNLTV